MSTSSESINTMPASPGPDILLDTDLLSGASSPAIPLLDDSMDSQADTGITGNWASDQSLEFRQNLSQNRDPQPHTDVCSSASSDEMTIIFCPPSKNIPVVQTASATAASGSRSSPLEGSNSRQAMGPPRNGPLRLNGLVYSANLHAVLRVVEFYRNGKVRLQDPYNARRRPLLDPADLVAIPVDNSAENRDLRDQLIRLRRSREAHERDLYQATNEIDKLKARISELNQMLDDSRTANRLLSAKVVTLEKKQPKKPKSSKVRNAGVNTDTMSASESCSTTCRHLRGLQNEFRSLRSQLLRGNHNPQNKKIKRKPRSRSSSSSSSSGSETE
ncbi:uncharacterized protein LOC142350654 [Convolutriloba macropyga]|uniref:uncharacterized protein LOC142350654 n=1 Tax=Convolutriloba macropyga TaxID=536237 RepID=UPI003F521F41